jgi:hypothetical protein
MKVRVQNRSNKKRCSGVLDSRDIETAAELYKLDENNKSTFNKALHESFERQAQIP